MSDTQPASRIADVNLRAWFTASEYRIVVEELKRQGYRPVKIVFRASGRKARIWKLSNMRNDMNNPSVHPAKWIEWKRGFLRSMRKVIREESR